MIGPSQHRTAGRPVEFNGKGLILHGRMSHQNPNNALLGFTGDGPGDAESNVDLTPPF